MDRGAWYGLQSMRSQGVGQDRATFIFVHAQSCLTLCNPVDCSPYKAPLSMEFSRREILEWFDHWLPVNIGDELLILIWIFNTIRNKVLTPTVSAKCSY